MTEIHPFAVKIPQAVLDDLSDRLARARWPDEVDGAGWGDYGSNLEYMRELCDYWQNKFDWQAQEKVINQFAHFRVEIEGIVIHSSTNAGRAKIPCQSCSCMAGPAPSCKCKNLFLFWPTP